LRRVVDFEAIPLKVPLEVSGTQAIRTRFIALLAWLRGGWWCLHLDVVVDLPGVGYLLTYGWGSCNEFLLSTSSSGDVSVLVLLALFICFSILRWYIRRDDQDLAI
jgi:hypothetical protein